MFRKIVKFYNKDRESFFDRLYTRLYGIVLQNFLLKKIWNVFKIHDEPEDWIIVLSNYNSGSTLLRNILSSANEIAYFPDESVLYTKTIKRPDEEFGWQRNWVYCEDQLKLEDSDKLRFNKYLKDVIPAIISKRTSKFVLEKSISNITRIGWFEKQCKSVKFIAIVRDPIASCEGMSRKSQPVGEARIKYGQDTYKTKDLALQYKISNEEILKMQSQVRNMKIIKYEELCEDPNKILNQLFDYLELNNVQLKIDNKKLEINGFTFEFKNMNSKSYKNLTNTQIEEIEMINKSLIKKLGYEKIK